MDDVVVMPDIYMPSNADPVVPVVPDDDHGTRRTRTECSRGHERQERRTAPSRRQVRVAQAVNFLLYGITLLIPGIAMIIVYFVVFRIPAGDIQWSPADAFVITGAILVGFSIVSEFIGLWQFCMSRYESDEPQTTNSSTDSNNRYSDSPPAYNTVAAELPDIVISVVQDSEENPPAFETCVGNNRMLPGVDNQAFDGFQTDEEDLPPPPSYPNSLKRKKPGKGVSVFVNQSNGTVKFTTADIGEQETRGKDNS